MSAGADMDIGRQVSKSETSWKSVRPPLGSSAVLSLPGPAVSVPALAIWAEA